MERTSTLLQPLSQTPNYQPDPEYISDELERLKVFVPEVSQNDSRNLLMFALAYVEHYRGDVLRLEHEKEFLCVALNQAWQQAKYDLVVRLVLELTQLAGRLNDLTEAEQILPESSWRSAFFSWQIPPRSSNLAHKLTACR